jgi:hypothetical protein
MMRVYPDYVVMSNGSVTWSVQREYLDKDGNSYGKTRFFKYVSKDTRNQLVIQEQQSEIEKLRVENERLKQGQSGSSKPRLF